MENERRLAAIMFTDVVGYAALTQKDEALAMKLLEEHRALVRPHFAKHGGREVKTIGDAFLVEFGSALEAVRCAFDIQQSVRDLARSRPADGRVELRIGIHLGDVIHSQGDVYGDAVNVASRIEPLAAAGGICISEEVYRQVRNKLEFPMVSLGARELKNMGEAVGVFSVVLPWERQEAASQSHDRERVAVLPFANMSPDPNDEYFADGMTEELITSLSGVKQFTVIARTSVMRYKGSQKGASDVGKELGVGSLLEGSVRKAGNRVRITAQLVDTATEGHLWVQNYDRNLDDIFAVQSEIAEKVAGELKIQLLQSEKNTLEKKPTENMEAYTLYLRAKQLSHQGSEAGHMEASALLEKALSLDPSFVLAYAQQAYDYRRSSIQGDYTTATGKAEVAAKKAIELGPGYAEAHIAMAEAHMALDRLDEARREMQRAVEINPNLSEAYMALTENHTTFGRFDEALSCARKASDLDPLSNEARERMAWTLRVAGRPDEALQEYEMLKELGARGAELYVSTSLCYLQKSDLARAADELTQAKKLSPDGVTVRGGWGMLYAKMGKRHEAEAELEQLSRVATDWGKWFSQLWVRNALGDLDAAFDALMNLAEIHGWPYAVKFDPLLEPLQSDPRFKEFCLKVGLPP
ncbi:MAG TPA: adenylate/guanylate cyclase domain-containing protein [Nitrososphaerales archaeon]|nr:adenylate/guanylate cyclase domain-containing protein [Nitrososphaerales archaeon]